MERLKDKIREELKVHKGSEQRAANKAKIWFEDHKKGNLKSLDLNSITGYLHPGKIHSFKYNPKTKNYLNFYDKNPMVLSLGTTVTSNGRYDIGINLNFIPRKARHYILDFIQYSYRSRYDSSISSSSRQQPKDQKSVKLSYRYLSALLDKVGFKFAIRVYIPQRRSKTYVLSNDLWHKAAVIDIKDFEGISEFDLLKIHREYIKK